MALGERFHHVERRMEEGATDQDALATFADVSLAVHRLKLLAQEHFYTPPDSKSAQALGDG
jgi:hypothetical protein